MSEPKPLYVVREKRIEVDTIPITNDTKCSSCHGTERDKMMTVKIGVVGFLLCRQCTAKLTDKIRDLARRRPAG